MCIDAYDASVAAGSVCTRHVQCLQPDRVASLIAGTAETILQVR